MGYVTCFIPTGDSDGIHYIQMLFDCGENSVNIAREAFSIEVYRGI